MPTLSPEKKAELLAASREAAAALVEDIMFMRGVVANNDPSRAEIRRLSALLRRVLVDRDLALVASPRLGRVSLLGPDNNSAYRAERKIPFLFFSSGRAMVLGGWVGTIFAFDLKPASLFTHVDVPILNVDATIELSLDTFLTQRVLCYRGEWVNRQQVITYVANKASGVHSTAPEKPDEVLLARLRRAAAFSVRGNGIHLDLFPNGIDVDESNFKHTPDCLDPVFIELLAAATFLVKSPFIDILVDTISAELGAAQTRDPPKMLR